MGKRLALKQFRVGLDMNQQAFADGMGYNRGFYGKVENGQQNGTIDFWNALQKAYNVPDAQMWGLMRND